MTNSELTLEKRHARFMVNFLKIHTFTERGRRKYQYWVDRYKELKNK